jgi:hypothetical protein
LADDTLLMAQALEAITKLQSQVAALNAYIDGLEKKAGVAKSRRPSTGILPVPVGRIPNSFSASKKSGDQLMSEVLKKNAAESS